MDPFSKTLKCAKWMSAVVVFAGMFAASADSVRGQQAGVLPMAYTSYYCLDEYCDMNGARIVSPDMQTGGPDEFAPTWSPDGAKIAFGGSGEIMVMNAAGVTNITNTAATEYYPAWSPTGQLIAFLGNADGPFEVYVARPDGSQLARVTTGGTVRLSRPTWSADGTRLAYECMVDQGNLDICAVDVDGTDFLRLTTGVEPDGSPAWSPDGTTILFVSSRLGLGALVLMRPDGSGQTILSNEGIPAWNLAWAPDGRTIAFSSYDNSYSWFGVGIFMMRVDGNGLKLLVPDAAEPAWRPGALYPVIDASCTDLTCTFNGVGSIGDISSYAWRFGDQTTGTGGTVTHTYPNGGHFTVELTVRDAGGASATALTTVAVNRLPVASFDVTCDLALTCRFEGTAFDPDGPLINTDWRFGDGTGLACESANCLNAQHTYAVAATYTATLQVTDNQGAITAATRTFTVDKPLMHIGDLEGTVTNNTGTWTASVTIFPHTANHVALTFVIVTAMWNDGTPVSCANNGSAVCTISRTVKPPARSLALTITGMSHAGFAYAPAFNHDRDGDSNGTTVTVQKRQ